MREREKLNILTDEHSFIYCYIHHKSKSESSSSSTIFEFRLEREFERSIVSKNVKRFEQHFHCQDDEIHAEEEKKIEDQG